MCAKYKYMKRDTHPKYYPKAKVICACGNTFTVGSTQELIEVEICSNCHPFYTGKEKLVDAVLELKQKAKDGFFVGNFLTKCQRGLY